VSREITNMRAPALCPKCGATPKIEIFPPHFGDVGSVVFSCCAMTLVGDDIAGARQFWNGAVLGYGIGFKDAAHPPVGAE
jgi:hypothetical protein